MNTIALVLLVLAPLTGCSKSTADATRAELIPSPMAGYTCFAIKNGAGDTVGGNCIKD